MRDEEILWWQRAHSDYLKYEDANTRWFHSSANMQRVRNSISCLIDDEGVRHGTDEGITNVITEYFGSLFSSSFELELEDVLDCVPSQVTYDVNESLCKPYIPEEITIDLRHMHPYKAPGPNDMNPFFYLRYVLRLRRLGKLWESDVPSDISSRASKDMYDFIRLNLI
ncbi:hypothetical protein Cgig2_025569 [Carnegiea gigantea]|uniref:Uncharacterized protein n=1 Tax=Carnegiea gigantea TaxID=171969 RepID=A0A9Q1JY07_9CARY|nr:hypothetical protein Cgig2_025569 [Carnegiea gigantea]